MADRDLEGSDSELAAILRQLRHERDEELAELEDETERLEVKQSDLRRVGLMAMMAGERWKVVVGERSFEGTVAHVGSDFVGLVDDVGNLFDAPFTSIGYVSSVGTEPSVGRAPTTLRPATFRGRLLGLQEHRPVEVGGLAGTWSLEGTIDSVNVDHMMLDNANGSRSVIPLASVAFIVRRPQQSRRAERPPRSR